MKKLLTLIILALFISNIFASDLTKIFYVSGSHNDNSYSYELSFTFHEATGYLISMETLNVKSNNVTIIPKSFFFKYDIDVKLDSYMCEDDFSVELTYSKDLNTYDESFIAFDKEKRENLQNIGQLSTKNKSISHPANIWSHITMLNSNPSLGFITEKLIYDPISKRFIFSYVDLNTQIMPLSSNAEETVKNNSELLNYISFTKKENGFELSEIETRQVFLAVQIQSFGMDTNVDFKL